MSKTSIPPHTIRSTALTQKSHNEAPSPLGREAGGGAFWLFGHW